MKFVSDSDYQKLKARGFCPEALAEARQARNLTHRALELIPRIERAFAGITLGDGIGLCEARGIDNHEDEAQLAERRKHDIRDDWRKLTAETLNFYKGFSFLDRDGMIFHIPAFLICELRGELDCGKLHHEFTCPRCDYISLLSMEQRQCIRDFLLIIREDPEYQSVQYDIDSSLESYWQETTT
ncbi:hypothetical protein SAMN02745181_3431 [Rubritalea squalenifaciens DSM 18772]|uniref:Uncharacterized protein n=1 Tax=Rubritalea squalenifaciens DSM 18772 TaxID=1123071 RepID=A0A1M6QL35_9BACT|nr:DUF6714 family protein [Rubritalea squalenifaciens]SHK20888.1 hypothetical protein SAMN02745181_3431 [Rubritalea squalenifaciens DSM 18772]